jgi:hypothetical protein
LVPHRSRETGNFVCHVTPLYLERRPRRCSLNRTLDPRLEALLCLNALKFPMPLTDGPW